jgi:replication initiation and membrane attachment protein DnaB
MKHKFPPFLLVLLASVPVVDVVADSTDEALNQFYVENMAGQLTSQAVGTANEKPADNSARGKEGKAHKEAKIRPSSKVQVRSNQTTK